MRRRRYASVLVIGLWLAGVAMLVRREYFRSHVERLAIAALRVNPGAVYFGAMRNTELVGFASRTIDTSTTDIVATDYMVAELPEGGPSARTSLRSTVVLSRGMRLRSFDVVSEGSGSDYRASGEVDGDSVVVVEIRRGSGAPDKSRIGIAGPVIVPTMIPVAVALTERPRIGRRYRFPVLDPATLSVNEVIVAVRAESVFVLNDSARFDAATRTWIGTYPDTVRAWHIASAGGDGFSGWIDQQGQVVQQRQAGVELRRLPFEEAFGNWRRAEGDSASPNAVGAAVYPLESTAIVAGTHALAVQAARMLARVRDVDAAVLQLQGGRQTLRGDTVEVVREPDRQLNAAYTLPGGGRLLAPAESRAEPLIPSGNVEIAQLARELRDASTDPKPVVERIVRWVHDSLAKEPAFGTPSAVDVLQDRRGDCAEHTRLFIAIARASGVPARAVSGVTLVDGRFYYHTWAEVLLADWVSVDPTFGQFPASATSIRLAAGLVRQADLLRTAGNMGVDLLSVSPGS